MPYLKEKFGAKGIIKNRVLRTAGIGESLVDEKMGDLEKLKNPIVGLAAHAGQTDIRIAAQADTEEEADWLIGEVETEIRKRLGSFIYGVDKEPLEQAFVEAVQRAGVKIAIVEVGTGGVLRQRIESQPQGAASIISAELFDTIDGLNGAGDETDFKAIAERAATTAREKAGAAIAIAIISEERGTAIAVSGGTEMRSRTYGYGGMALGGAEWASGWGMSMSWHMLSNWGEAQNK
jgi:nicotinamide-nucleotide amidase